MKNAQQRKILMGGKITIIQREKIDYGQGENQR